MTSLTIFYDGQCPLCTREINALRARDNKAAMTFEDLHQVELAEKYPMIQKDQAFQMIHGLLDGKVIKGIDVNYHAWRLVGKEAWVAPLRWRLTRPLAQLGYRLFARYRHQISSVYSKITGDDCACATNISKPKSKQHSKE